MKLIIFVFILIATNPVYASKARVVALGNAFHLIDTQSIYFNPLQLNNFGNYVAVETGLTTATTTRNNAEAAIGYVMPESNRIAVTLGKKDDMSQTARTFMNSIVGANTYNVSQNPIHLTFAHTGEEVSYAFGLFYSNLDDKVNVLTESSAGINFAVKNKTSMLIANFALVNSVEAAAAKKFDGAGYFRLGGRHKGEELSYGLDYFSWTAKSQTAGVENESYGVQTLLLRIIKSIKFDGGSELFYGIGYVSNKVNCKVATSVDCSTTFSRTNLPVIVGLEANASDWLIMRGSITQSLVHDAVKDEIGLTAASGIAGASGAVSDFSAAPNNTTIAAGVGLKFNNVLIDGTLSGVNTQLFNSANIFSQLALTYKF